MIMKPENPKELALLLNSKPLILYGMGYVGRLIAKWCDDNNITYIFSDRSADQKKSETEKEVIPPELLAAKYPNANVVIASINYYEEIRTYLRQEGFHDGCILPYLLFWPRNVSWKELEDTADWDAVKERAGIFASWIDPSAKTVADYSAEKHFLKEFLPKDVIYYSPDYIQLEGDSLFANFQGIDVSFQADVSSCIAVLMSFKNPEAVIGQICSTTRKAIILSYVTLEKMPDKSFRRSINYMNDFTEIQLIKIFDEHGFLLRKKAIDPFDEVHWIYMFERQSLLGK